MVWLRGRSPSLPLWRGVVASCPLLWGEVLVLFLLFFFSRPVAPRCWTLCDSSHRVHLFSFFFFIILSRYSGASVVRPCPWQPRQTHVILLC